MASSANGNVKITTEIETAGLQESLNRLESMFNSFAGNLKETARKTGEDVNRELGNTEKARISLEKLGNTAKNIGSQLKTLGLAAAGLAGSFAGIVKSAISTADRVDELSKRLGMSVESLSRLDYVASQSGTSIEAFGTSMRMIAQNINTGSDAYEKLGVNIREADGQLKSQEQILLETIRALQRMPAGTEKAALALKALGRNSMQLNEVLGMTEDEFDALMKRSDELGLTLNSNVTNAAQQIADKFTDLRSTFKMALVQAVEPMIPALEKVTDRFIKMLQPGGELAEAFKTIAQAGLSVVENVLPALISGLAWVVKNGPAVIAVFTAIKTALQALTGNWVGAIATLIGGTIGTTVLYKATKAKKAVDNTTESIKKLDTETRKIVPRINATTVVADDATDAFQQWTDKLDAAQVALKKFIAENSTLDKGFNVKTLAPEKVIELNKLKSNVAEAKDVLQTLQDAMVDVQEEITKTDPFEKWSSDLKKAEDDLKDFVAVQAALSGGVFDVKLLSDDSLAQFDELKAKVAQARTALDSLTDAMKEQKDGAEETVETTEESKDAFDKWTQAVTDAETALKEFVAERSNLEGGFSVESLSPEELSVYDELKAKLKQAKDAINSMNDALEDTKEELVETDAFDKWTKAVAEADKALKEFIATKAEASGGSFDVENLTDAERQQFEKLRETVKQAKAELQSLQDATKETTDATATDLADVANVIAQAWGAVGSAFGNGIESVAEVIASGANSLSDVMGGLADTMAGALSAVGDALIQSGIAKMVAENLAKSNMSSAAAIALGMSIKLAAGALKGFLQRIRNAGGFANGGIVGGSSFSGDRMTANVNSGEMIINRKQQAALWDFIRNGSNGGGNAPNIEIINNAGVDIQTESNTDGRSLRIMVNQQIERFLGSPAGGRIMRQTYGARQLGRR